AGIYYRVRDVLGSPRFLIDWVKTCPTAATVSARVPESPLVLIASVLALACARRRGWEFLACVALYLIPPLLFTNLYAQHEYYGYANGLFLVAAVGVSLAALWETGPVYRAAAWVGLVLAIAAAFDRYYGRYYVPQHEGGGYALVVEALEKDTRPDDLIVLVGY